MISAKVHETPKGKVVGACDADLLGKSLREEGLRLELTEDFYFERRMRPEELAQLLDDCMTANLVGELAVNAYCARNPEAEGSVIKIGGVPHLQVFRI